MGWSKLYSPSETLIYYWDVQNNLANIMDPDKGEFTVPYPGLYILSFYGTISPDSSSTTIELATMMVGNDEAADAFSAYATGSMQVLRRLPKGKKVYVRNGEYFYVKWVNGEYFYVLRGEASEHTPGAKERNA